MTQEPIIAELALCIAELHDRVRRLQEENQDLVHQLGKSDSRINELIADNERLKARLVPYEDENPPMPRSPFKEDRSSSASTDLEDLKELRRKLDAYKHCTMTEPSPYEAENSATNEKEALGIDTCMGHTRTSATGDSCTEQCAVESIVDTSHGYTYQDTPLSALQKTAPKMKLKPNTTTTD